MNKNELINIFIKIKEFENIIIHRHIRPDGDCIGSQMGLKELLKASFPEKNIYTVGDKIPDYLSFLGENDVVEDSLYEDALVIVVDTSVADRISDERFKLGKYIIKIDHHDDSIDFGNINYVNPTVPATGSLIVEFFLANSSELVLNKLAATALYTAIISDTGRFQYRGVNGDVLRNAGVLIDAGINIEEIYSRLYLKEFELFRLQGYVYKNIKQTKNGVAYIHFTKKIMDKFGVSKEDAGALVNSLASIKGSLIWVAFIDHEDGTTRVRIRSRFVEINDIATEFRGGGHLMAAGATIHNQKEKRALLQLLDFRLAEYKNEYPGIE